MTGDSPSIIQAEVINLRAENASLRKFFESIVDANGPYPELNGKPIVRDAYTALNAPRRAAHPPRFFCETSTGMTWEFRNGKMTTDGEDSMFKSPAEILECLDVIEVDEFGNPLAADDDDIAGERGDRQQQQESDEA